MSEVIELMSADGEVEDFCYRRFTLAKNSPGEIVRIDRLPTLFAVDRESYASHFAFTEEALLYIQTNRNEHGQPSMAKYPGPCYTPRFTIDIDDPQCMLEGATDTCQKLLQHLVDDLKFDPSHIQVWCSGYKGYHVEIPTSPWGLRPGINFNLEVKKICLSIAKSAGIEIDSSLYDRVRLLRAPFSRHPKTELHKIPIRAENILSGLISVEDMSLSKDESLTLQNLFELPPCELDLKLLAQTILSEPGEIKLEERSEYVQNGDDAVVGLEKVRKGGRNRTLLSLAGTMHKRKMSEKSVLAALLAENAERCDPPLPDDEVRTIATNIQQYPDSDSKKGESGSFVTKIIDLVTNNVVELFRDERGEAYVLLKPCDGRKIVRLGAKGFLIWMSRLVWSRTGKPPSRDMLSTARSVLEGMAHYQGKQYALHVRVASHEGKIWIDLDGSRAICVAPNEWKIVDDPPILFRQPPAYCPLPDPVRGGDFWQVLKFVKLNDRAQRLCFACHLITAFVPDVPIVVVIAQGAHGAAKTTFLKVIKRIIDPSKVEVIGGVKDLSEYAQIAFQNRVFFFDNLSYLPDWLSDAFCRTVSGDGWLKRTLHSDEDTTVFHFRRLIGFSGINLVAGKADILDRSMIYSLERIADDERMEERLFWPELEKCQPEIFGSLLDMLAKAMDIMPTLQLPKLPRMADYAKWAAAAAVALGYTPEQYLQAYAQNTSRQNEAAIEASPVAQAVLYFMSTRTEWEGTPASLLEALECAAIQLKINTKIKSWPTGPSWLTRRLNEVHPNLTSLGITILHSAKKQERRIEIKSDHAKRASVTGGNASNDYAIPPHHIDGVSPACDVNDGIDSKSAIFGGEPHGLGGMPLEEVLDYELDPM